MKVPEILSDSPRIDNRRLWRCAEFFGPGEIRCVQTIDLRPEILDPAAVVDDVVRLRQTLGARHLRSHDRANFGRIEAAAGNDAGDLLGLRAVNDEHALISAPVDA